MSIFSKGINGRGANIGRGNDWKRGHRRPQLSIHFGIDPQELNHLFQDGLFNLVGQGILQPRPERHPFHPHQKFSSICLPPHISMQPKPPANYGWQEIVHHPDTRHNGWPTVSFPLPPTPLPFNSNSQVDNIVSPFKSSHARKNLKTTLPEPEIDKGKKWPIPLTLPRIPLNQYPPIFTSKTIAPVSSTRSTLKFSISVRLQ